MPTKRNLVIAVIVSLPLFVGACATSDRGSSSEASVGSSSQAAARGLQGFHTNNQEFDYPSY